MFLPRLIGLVSLALLALVQTVPASAIDERPRVIVLADMGHDPDEEQQIAHLLAASNMMALEGLVTVTGRFFRPDPPSTIKWHMPELFHGLIDGYEEVYPNLQLHADGWHTPDYLRSIVVHGQTGNGMSDVGKGKQSAGAALITASVLRDDPRPVHIIVNAGSNTLAQALFDYRAAHSAEETADFVSRLIVYDNGGQDEAGAWILREFPEIHYVRSGHQARGYGGYSNEVLGPYVWQPYAYDPIGQHQWAREHVQTGHGALGAKYPDRTVTGVTHFIEGGGTIPWMGFVAAGLTDPTRPSWGGWSGRYSVERQLNPVSAYDIVAKDEAQYLPITAYSDNGITESWTDPGSGETFDSEHTPVWRWRKAMWSDLRARMDWAVAPFAEANHHPRAVLNGDTSDAIKRVSARPGDTVPLSATGSSDPDGDGLSYSWWVYHEAGERPYGQKVAIMDHDKAESMLAIPADAAGHDLHVILEVTDDDAEVPLVDYRRMVIEVR